MTVDISEFHKFFNPNSIAIVGVSSGTYRFGGTSFLNKLQESGFAGRLYPLNPKAETINDLKAYPNLSSLPETPDLAIVCVAAKRIPKRTACYRPKLYGPLLPIFTFNSVGGHPRFKRPGGSDFTKWRDYPTADGKSVLTWYRRR
ncbi:MAG: CoA-binding protein [Deltaproteobacteria bacterium]|nr:CoA-binding protein [Deltaproteobacteria bacterium]